jgi:hypothetical protein
MEGFAADVRDGLLAWFDANGFEARDPKIAVRAAILVNPDPLSAVGVPDADDLVVAYYNLMRRRIAPRPRKVILSKEFQAAVAKLSPDHLAGWQDIERACRSGADLRARLSKSFENTRYNDGMLNDWALHHLHLGAAQPPGSSGRAYVARSGPLAFAHVTDGEMYFVDIKPHKDASGRAFEDVELPNIIHTNWPHLTVGRRMFEAYDPADALRAPRGDVPTSDELRRAREAGIIALFPLPDGTVLAPLGGGAATNRQSGKVRSNADYFWEAVVAHRRTLGNAPARLVLRPGDELLRFGFELNVNEALRGR